MGKDPNIWTYLENTVIRLAGDLYKSILRTFSDYSSEFSQSDEVTAKILVYTIFLECFMIRNELLTLGQDEQEVRFVLLANPIATSDSKGRADQYRRENHHRRLQRF